VIGNLIYMSEANWYSSSLIVFYVIAYLLPWILFITNGAGMRLCPSQPQPAIDQELLEFNQYELNEVGLSIDDKSSITWGQVITRISLNMLKLIYTDNSIKKNTRDG
jgi:hypothetical protein